MKLYVPIVFAVLLIFGNAACAPVAPATTQDTPTSQAGSSEPYHSLTTRTGIEKIDQVLDAVERGDMQALLAQVEFLSAPCTKGEGFGGPPKCLESEAEGTPVEALAFLGSEGGHLRKTEIDKWTGVKASGVYAIYDVLSAVISEQYYPAGKYAILFVDEPDRSATAVRIGESGIVRLDHIFDSSSAALNAIVEAEASTVILPPKS